MLKRVILPVAAIFALSLLPANAVGEIPVFNPLNPDSGPSPNVVHVSGDGCSFEVSNGSFGGPGVVLGGLLEGGFAFVQLYDKDDPDEPVGPEQGPYEASDRGTWSGSFNIPGGLEPGTYPAKARCTSDVEVGPAGIALAQTTGFNYAQTRSYTVVAERDPAKAVEAEVKLTG